MINVTATCKLTRSPHGFKNIPCLYIYIYIFRNDYTVETKSSISYNAMTKEFLNVNGLDIRSLPDELSRYIYYVDNIFMDLNNLYLSRKQPYYKNRVDVHDEMLLLGVDMFLRNLLDQCPLDKSVYQRTFSDYHFTIILPTHWDFEIREELIRPLFIKAGLIQKDDNHDRLLFFSKLESNFRYIKSLDDCELKIGNKYLMYGLNRIGDNLIIALDYFTLHYPLVTAVDCYYVIKELKSVYVTVPVCPEIKYGNKQVMPRPIKLIRF